MQVVRLKTTEQKDAYRTPHLLARKKDSGELIKTRSDGLEAIQTLPIFMDGWANAAAQLYEPNRILTATVNASSGCPIGKTSLCGTYCFAHISWEGTQIKNDTAAKYIRDINSLRSAGLGVSIFLSTDTEPFPGQGGIDNITYNLLRAMIECPPDGVLIHSHTSLIGDPKNVEVLKALSQRTNLIAGIGFETDAEEINNLPGHHSSVKDRIAAFKRMVDAGIKTQASITPLMGFVDFRNFITMFRDLGAYRVMVGELRKEFDVGGSEMAKKLNLGLPYPEERDALDFGLSLGFPGGVALRETFYVLLP